MLTWIFDMHVDKIKGVETPFVPMAKKYNHTIYCLRDSYLPQKIDFTEITLNGPTIIRGSHGFVNLAHEKLNPQPGGFIHPTNFQLSVYGPVLKDLVLNFKHKIITYDDFLLNRSNFKGDIFVKPAENLKAFTGLVITDNDNEIADAHFRKFGKWIPLAKDCKIIISSAVDISKEYRFVIVDGVPITGAFYNETDSSLDVPDSVWETAKEIASLWQPADVFVADIAETSEGNKLVEYNQFSTSAMYACNQEKIVQALISYLV